MGDAGADRGAMTMLRIPKVKASPKEIHAFRTMLRYDKEGLKVLKLNDSGRFKDKRLFIDNFGARLFYAPSFKSVQLTSMSFRSIVVVDDSRAGNPALQYVTEAQGYPVTLRSAQGRLLTFLVPDQGQHRLLIQTLSFMIRRSMDGADEDPRMVRIYDLWLEADRDGNGYLDKREMMRILRRMGVSLSASEIDKIFSKFDRDGSGTIDYDEFVELYGYLTQLPVLQPLFSCYLRTKEDSLIPLDRMRDYFARAQHEDVDDRTIGALIRYYSKKEDAQGLSFANFSQFVADGAKNSWIPPSKMNIDLTDEKKREAFVGDMSRPFADYFISSTHNTFLTGSQLVSDSSISMIGIALQLGARAVELEVWDGPSGDPQVFRGLGERINVRDAINAIDEHAFTTNPFPVFLVLELHCCDDQAAVLARLLEKGFGTKVTHFSELPPGASPGQFLERVIVCYKYRPNDPDAHKSVKTDQVIATDSDSKRVTLQSVYDDLKKSMRPSYRDVGREALIKQTGAAMVPVTENVLDEHIVQEFEKAHRGHLAIAQIESLNSWTREHQNIVRTYADAGMVRVYPSVSEHLQSSNVDAMAYFASGVSMVALNFQTYDTNMRTAEAFFKQNGACGYVPKPVSLRPGALREPDAVAVPVRAAQKYILTVTVIAGSSIPNPGNVVDQDNEVIDPYVCLALGGTPEDVASNPMLQTSIVEDNGFNPEWNEEFSFTFSDIEFATLTLQVKTKASPVHKDIVHASAPLSMIRLGYRAVPLYFTHDGSLAPSAVLVCHFSLTLEGDRFDDYDGEDDGEAPAETAAGDVAAALS